MPRDALWADKTWINKQWKRAFSGILAKYRPFTLNIWVCKLIKIKPETDIIILEIVNFWNENKSEQNKLLRADFVKIYYAEEN